MKNSPAYIITVVDVKNFFTFFTFFCLKIISIENSPGFSSEADFTKK